MTIPEILMLRYEVEHTAEEIWADCMNISDHLTEILKAQPPLETAAIRKLIKNFMNLYPDARRPFPQGSYYIHDDCMHELYSGNRWDGDVYIEIDKELLE